MTGATLLLPGRARFGGQRLPEPVATRLARADRSQHKGDAAARLFDMVPRGWPVAAATRQMDVGDAADAIWLRADPAYIRPDINGARLLAFGDALSLTVQDSDAFLPALKPVFGDAGFVLDAPHPSRWYLRLTSGARLPAMASPGDALGADLLEQLPGADEDGSVEARRWRSLLNDAQITLHQHPRNAQRVAAGLAPVNSLWFWGAGTLPHQVRAPFTQVLGDDPGLHAFARLAGAAAGPLPPRWHGGEGELLFDLRGYRDLALLGPQWLLPAVADLDHGVLQRLCVASQDGTVFDLRPRQRWRFWRKPLRTLDA